MKKLLLIILLVAMFPLVNVYSAEDDIEIVTYKMTNIEGEEVSDVVDVNDIIYIEIIVKNHYQQDTDAKLFITVSDAQSGRLRGIKEVDGGSLLKYGKTIFKTKLDLSTMDGIKSGDKITLFFWDSLVGMHQLMGAISEERTQNAVYETNSIIDYNPDTNFNGGDRWSYHHSDVNAEDESIIPGFGLCGNSNGTWFLDAVGKNDTWLIDKNGNVVNELGRAMNLHYTIGDYTSGKTLTIKGKFKGDPEANLVILKTDDESTSEIVCKTIAETKIDILSKPGGDEIEFEYMISPEEAIKGNDIIFSVIPTSTGVYQTNINITITAKDVPVKKTNSIEDYSGENVIGATRWSYIDKPLFTLNDDSQTEGILTYTDMLVKGDGTTITEEQYYSDAESNPKKCYITPDGNIYTGKHAVGYVYTLGADFMDAQQIIVDGSSVSGANNNVLTIIKTCDADSAVIGENAEILYTGTSKANTASVVLPIDECNIGDDIVFIVESKSTAYWQPIATTFSVTALLGE